MQHIQTSTELTVTWCEKSGGEEEVHDCFPPLVTFSTAKEKERRVKWTDLWKQE